MIDALFGSKTRVKLLYLFLNNPDKSFYVREITRKIDEQINSVRRELSNMLDIGIIKSDSKDNKLYYSADKKYKFFTPLKQIFSNAENTAVSTDEVSDIVKKFKGIGDVRVVILAGKLANGFDSEVDMLVAGSVSKVKLKNLVKTIEAEEGVSIAYTTIPYDDFYYRLSVRDQFISDILAAKHSVIIDTENILNGE
ncbi:transcriptional regulator [Alphaproteobacteria bacterium]|nr:transcriptional regulator [Alphaproteobacteria bacterium]